MRLATESIRLVSGRAETMPRRVAGSNPARGSTLQVRSTPFISGSSAFHTTRKSREDSSIRSPQHCSRPSSDTGASPTRSESVRTEQEDDSAILRSMQGRGIETTTTTPTPATHEADRWLVEEAVRQGDQERCSEVSRMAGETGTRRLDKARLQGRAEEVLQVAQEQRDISAGGQLDQDHRQQRPSTPTRGALDGG